MNNKANNTRANISTSNNIPIPPAGIDANPFAGQWVLFKSPDLILFNSAKRADVIKWWRENNRMHDVQIIKVAGYLGSEAPAEELNF